MRILIADDEVSIIQLIRKLIRPELGPEIVGEATDGKSALALIEQTHQWNRFAADGQGTGNIHGIYYYQRL